MNDRVIIVEKAKDKTKRIDIAKEMVQIDKMIETGVDSRTIEARICGYSYIEKDIKC